MNVSTIKGELKLAQAEVAKWQAVVTGLIAALTAMGSSANVPAETTGKRAGRPKGSKNKSSTQATDTQAQPTTAEAPADGKRSAGRPLSSTSLRAYVERVLADKPNGMSVPQILQAVKDAGYESQSKTLDKQIASTLASGFRRVERGVYALPGDAPVAEAPAAPAETATAATA